MTPKTCSYDCIYCQLGRTTDLTAQRGVHVPVDDLLSELRDHLASAPDYITLGGSGEPTLHADIGAIIDGIRSLTDIPVAVITNGSLLWQDAVRQQLAAAHLVVPSLDAGDDKTFQAINRPHPDITWERMISGLREFRAVYAGRIWLEVMLVAGINSHLESVQAIAAAARSCRPDKIQLNTVERPSLAGKALRVDRGTLNKLRHLFTPCAEVISDQGVSEWMDGADPGLDLLAMIRRRPCSLEEIARAAGMHPHEAAKHLGRLEHHGLIAVLPKERQTFYTAAAKAAHPKHLEYP